MKKLIIVIIAGLFVSCDLFHNTDIGNMLQSAQGTIEFNWAAVSPDLYSVKIYTNLVLTAKVTGTDAKIVSVEADLTSIGLGIVSMEKAGEIWSNQVWVKTVDAGSHTIIFNAVNEYGKSVQFNVSIRIFQNEAVYVAEWGDNTNSGLTNTAPVKSILKALQLYEEKGAAEIRVATGIYDEFINNTCVIMRPGMILKGGYDNTFMNNDPALYPTRIDGLSGNVYHVVVAVEGGKCTLDGLIISRGIANNDFLFNKHGGGILVLGTELVIKNCIIESNYALQCGGGIYVMDGSVTISNSVIRQNIAMSQGGACFFYNVSKADIDCTVISNTFAESGGGIYGKNIASFTMDDSVIAKSVSKKSGGTIYLDNGLFTLNNSLIHSGVLSHAPDGLDVYGAIAFFANGFLNMTGCIFSNNISSNTVNFTAIRGCGLYLSAITNFSVIQSIFFKSSAYSIYAAQGGAIMLANLSWGKIISNQISFNSNTATYNYGGAGIHLDNSTIPLIIDYNIFRANNPGTVYEGYSTAYPSSLKYNRFINSALLYSDYVGGDIYDIDSLNNLDSSGYNPPNSVTGNTTN
jgi:drug/metabolite transporter superfamily protein YnfA